MNEKKIIVSVKQQQLTLWEDEQVVASFCVSTAKNGTGQISGSECTPLGRHIIRAKIGHGCPENTVFVARRPTGEVFSEALRKQYPNRDWILTRIMWLSGCEPGYNRLYQYDTMRRYIYIHGCPDSDEMGKPSSHGCIKMKNRDVIELFERVERGVQVLIQAD